MNGGLDKGFKSDRGGYRQVRAANAAAGGGAARRYRIKSEQDDTVTCRTWDGTNEGATDVLVAKPPELRGNTASKTVNGEAQDIHPAYAVDDEIWADQPIGGTGVTNVVWMDTDRSSRAWTSLC